MTSASPTPISLDGLRTLSPRESMQRIKALSCALPNDRKPTCSGQVFVGLFFDGTGNNMREDYDKLSSEKRKQSNVGLFVDFSVKGHWRA